MHKKLAVVLLMMLSALAIIPAAYAQDEPVPRFEPSECPFEVPASENITCGYLIVPEYWSDPDGRTIELAIAILHRYHSRPQLDPIVYLDGGPGGSALDGWKMWLYTPFREERDFILIDQRGTGHSKPGLHCPEYDDLIAETLDELFEDEEAIKLSRETALACRDRLFGEGIDLAAYHTSESAADIAALRDALDYEALNLYGISYGTRLALTVMRNHPEVVRSVILDSTVALEANIHEEGAALAHRAFSTLFEGCAAHQVCNQAYPDLEERFYTFVEEANENPFRVHIENPYTGQMEWVWITGNDMLSVLFGALYDSSLIPYIPMMLDHTIKGDLRFLTAYLDLDLGYNAETDFSIGMYYSVQCYEEIPFNKYDAATSESSHFPELQGFLINDDDFIICPEWGVDAAPSIENEPVASDIPTLVLSGTYDPITPPVWGMNVANDLDDSYYFEYPGLGHGVTLNECAESMAFEFVDKPRQEPDASCMADLLSGPDFATGIIPTVRLYSLLEALLIEPDIRQFMIISLCLLAFGSAVTVWPVLRIVQYYRQQHNRSSGLVQVAGWLGFLSGGWNLLFFIALVIVIIMVIAEQEVMLIFGLPRWALPIRLMPFVSVLMTALLALLHVPVWKHGTWGMVGRLYYGFITLINALFVWWLFEWSLLSWPF